MTYRYIKRFSEIRVHEVAAVGGKNASLGEMVQALAHDGIPVPNGFATTAAAYRHFLAANTLDAKIAAALAGLDARDLAALEETGAQIRYWLTHAQLPADLYEELAAAYDELGREYGVQPDVAVRSSATAEDLADASFAGQQDTFLNIRGIGDLAATCVRVYASLFNDRAISYRASRGFDHTQVALSIGVQKMVRSDLACSGVMFTLDTETGFRDVVFINAAYGLGENVVQGAVNPDEFYVFKPTLAQGKRPIVKRELGDKAVKMIYARDTAAGFSTRNVAVPPDERAQFALSDDEILTLARYAMRIEQHYSQLAGAPRPMDIEWAKDGVSGELFIVQARPETVRAREGAGAYEVYHFDGDTKRGEILTRGKSVGRKIASGPARVINKISDMSAVQAGDVLVTDMTDPDWEPVMKIAAAIVTNRGGRTCHAAIVAREIGVPAVVGCNDATATIPAGAQITVSCAEGDTGYVYAGALAFRTETLSLADDARPRTKIMMNLANPDQAFAHSFLPNDGVGLARLEFIMARSIQAHPRALLEYERLSAGERRHIDALTAGYRTREEFFVTRLAEGIGLIASAFYPKPVIVRFSDFKSNEYASLFAGAQFEPKEENPMLGLRGAARYYHESFSASFALECAAILRVRAAMGLDNVAVMLPFVRSVDEARTVLDLMARHHLRRGENGLKVYLMCEIPANALLADAFLEHFDGMSIGSNDLTQLTMGVDRDSGIVGGFDERNAAVLQLMEQAIAAAKRRQKYIGICGQAPSDFPEMTRWLVQHGIDSISLNPDSVVAMTQVVLQAERESTKAEKP